MIEKVEFDPPNILAGRDNHLRRLAHQRHIQSVAPPFALGAIITQAAHGSPLDPRRHITYYLRDEYNRLVGPIHVPFSYEAEEALVARLERARSASAAAAGTAPGDTTSSSSADGSLASSPASASSLSNRNESSSVSSAPSAGIRGRRR
ncbi:predicted protein [Aspergillus terreus NIH2624]|uniref:Uncharacterized protein n=1 Tax=Aspergillus terreus (strain NIH 2624 / FGSC A1156) TaxID=341663 RepID=Q0D1A3_ASPTN|nr:uncharacterized protein ATEG_00281 [Aspergillus terreus NIH2624]EAU38927.1 predicted protein [Aspergillus terreus NIH2624]KAG2415464.1 hypothetical protein HFD88_006655 [Aspergillus terreus]